jgi:2-polyprenyl-6-methoxyphenol hydroxylase-like FAD-dependent oxidoreductase
VGRWVAADTSAFVGAMGGPMRVLVVGGSAGGLLASLLLARAGHEVSVLEQADLLLEADVEAAARSALRTSAPQIVHPHFLIARGRRLLQERLPDVYAALLAAGARDVPLSIRMPSTLSDRARWPGDDRFTTLATRRSTIDWVLRLAAHSETGISIRSGCRVAGLLVGPGAPPHVTGVRTQHGDLQADVVVDASGRRSAIVAWLADIGAAEPASWWAECGMAYFTRHHRVRTGSRLPGPSTSRLIAITDEFTVLLSGADNGVMQLAVIPLASDRRFRKLRDPDVHTAVSRCVPGFAPWLDGLEPFTDVYFLAGLHNTMRRLVVDGAPVATGIHAVADSVCTTNPTLARGLTLALDCALDLVEAVEAHPDDCTAQAIHYDILIGEHIHPFYTDQTSIDHEQLVRLRHSIEGGPAPEALPLITDRVTFRQLRAAAVYDPFAFRGLWEVMGMLRNPDDIYTDKQIVASTRTALGNHRGEPRDTEPNRNDLFAALAISL